MTGRFVVTGSGRCGTGYMAEALTALGFPCGHEAVFDHDDTTSGTFDRWLRHHHLQGDSSLAVVHHLHPAFPLRVIHVVRDPVATLYSFLGSAFFADTCGDRCHHPDGAHLETPYWQFMCRVVPGLPDEPDEMARAIRWIVESNRLIVSRSPKNRYLLVRLERMPTELERVTYHLGRPMSFGPISHLTSHLGRDVNRHDYPDRSWLAELLHHPLYGEFRHHQRWYGYV